VRNIFTFLVLVATISAKAQTTSQESVTLSEGWTFRQERLRNWHPATVPGTVHTDLMAIGSIGDPFFGLNERAVQWIDKEDWLYEKHFEVTEAQQQRARRELTFYGLDTYADVWLNDTLILEADNMFRTWHADVTRLTHVGKNHLRVRLYSPVKRDLPKWQMFPDEYHASSDQSENGGLLNRQLSPFIRKAPYHYGWDWGPRLVAMGIWRPVVFTAWDEAIIRDVFVEQQEVTRKRAVIRHHVTIEADHDVTATITVTDSASQRQLAKQTASLKRGLNTVTLPYTIHNPRLWWSNGLGKPHLYNLLTRVETTPHSSFISHQSSFINHQSSIINHQSSFISHHSSIINPQSSFINHQSSFINPQSSILYHQSSVATKVGLRSLRLHRVPDADGQGEAFYFTLNGEKVFMKGANYIPCDVFLPRVTDSIYRRTIGDAVAANMNMIRVWGGGVYEDNRFYELCDENGILVWQDFMFACSMYPADSAFLENIRQEAIDNVKRLRNHPCIALWCGNNEILDAWTNWGWKRQSQQRGGEVAERLWAEYQAIFLKTLPEVVARYAPQTQYQSTSPLAADDGKRDFTRGDYHYWEVWHGLRPISEYNTARARFFSEYGMQSFPELSSVKRFCPDPQEWSITSDVMMAHQRGGTHANELIERYLTADYGRPQAFDTLLYVGQLMQGEAMKTAVEAHRRDKGHCWGSLVWQLNDCWPVASWSTRDYYGRWKAAHYMIRRAMADILVSPIQQDSTLHIYIVNDRLTPVCDKFIVEVYKSSKFFASEASQAPSAKFNVQCSSQSEASQAPSAKFKVQSSKFKVQSSKLKVPANSSVDVWSMPVTQLLAAAGVAADEAIIHVEFGDYKNNYILVRPKELKLQPAHLQWSLKGNELTITSDAYARGIFLSLDGDPDHHFSDNYFDLLPGETRTVTVKTSLPSADLQRRISLFQFSIY